MLLKKDISFEPFTRKLQNSSGEKHDFTMRVYEPGDESGMVACILDEYGESYFKRDFYDEAKLREKALGDHYVFFVAKTEGEIAGMEIFALFTEDGDDYIEPASQIFRRKYRGYKLAEAMVEYTFALAKQMKPKALFVHAVTFHSITQKVCGAQGMMPTGFRLGSFLAKRMNNSYPIGNCVKYSEGIMILPIEKTDAGVVYLPQELSAVAADIYGRLGMRYVFSYEKKELPDEPAQLSVITDTLQRTVLIHLLKSGADLKKQIEALLEKHLKEADWTYQICFSISEGTAITEYEQLHQMGFFFAGLKAACAETEQLYMQWCGDIELHMEEYVLTEEFSHMREQIQEFYNKRERV